MIEVLHVFEDVHPVVFILIVISVATNVAMLLYIVGTACLFTDHELEMVREGLWQCRNCKLLTAQPEAERTVLESFLSERGRGT